MKAWRERRRETGSIRLSSINCKLITISDGLGVPDDARDTLECSIVWCGWRGEGGDGGVTKKIQLTGSIFTSNACHEYLFRSEANTPGCLAGSDNICNSLSSTKILPVTPGENCHNSRAVILISCDLELNTKTSNIRKIQIKVWSGILRNMTASNVQSLIYRTSYLEICLREHTYLVVGPQLSSRTRTSYFFMNWTNQYQ